MKYINIEYINTNDSTADTLKLIHRCAMQNMYAARDTTYIVVVSEGRAKEIMDLAVAEKYNIPYPLTINELIKNKNNQVKMVLIDNAGHVLDCLIRSLVGCNTLGFTLNLKEYV